MKLPLLHHIAVATGILLLCLVQTGCKKSSDDTVTAPTVETANIISSVTSTTAQCGGVVTNFGLVSITADGVCWSSSNATPTINDSKTSDAITSAIYVSSITGLTPGTTYYVRAYATNTGGTAYGSVLKFTTSATNAVSTATVSTFAGSGSVGFINGTGTGAQFNNPQGVATDAAGNIYVADAANNAIRKITAAGVVSTFAGSGAIGFTDGTGTNAQFYSPQGLATDAAGNVYVADLGNNAIRKITPAGVVTTLAGSGVAGWNDATGTSAQFKSPRGLVVDASGNVYVADKGNNRIRKITPAGVVNTVVGNTAAGYLDGTTSTAILNQPTGITIDPSGNFYISDLGNSAIRKIATDGTVTTFAGGGYDYTLMGLPTGITSDTAGNLYITDEAGRIMEITTSKVLYVLAGSATAGFINGSGTNALFNVPQTTAVDASGNLYVADLNNHVIRKVTISH